MTGGGTPTSCRARPRPQRVRAQEPPRTAAQRTSRCRSPGVGTDRPRLSQPIGEAVSMPSPSPVHQRSTALRWNAAARMTRTAGEHKHPRPEGATMNTALTAICRVPGAGCVTRSRRANAHLARGGRNRPVSATSPPRRARGQARRRAGSASSTCWTQVDAAGVVAGHLRGAPCGLYPRPHDAGKEQANAETGWRGYENSCSHPVPVITHR